MRVIIEEQEMYATIIMINEDIIEVGKDLLGFLVSSPVVAIMSKPMKA